MRDSTFASFSCEGRLSLVGLRAAGSALEPGQAAANLVRRPPPQGLAAGPRSASRRGYPAGGVGPLREPPGPVVRHGAGGQTVLRDADRQPGRRLVIVGRAARGTPLRRTAAPAAPAARAARAAGAALIGRAAAEPALGDARPTARLCQSPTDRYRLVRSMTLSDSQTRADSPCGRAGRSRTRIPCRSASRATANRPMCLETDTSLVGRLSG